MFAKFIGTSLVLALVGAAAAADSEYGRGSVAGEKPDWGAKETVKVTIQYVVPAEGATGLASLPAAGTWVQTALPALGASAGEWTLRTVLSGATAAADSPELGQELLIDAETGFVFAKRESGWTFVRKLDGSPRIVVQ